MTIGASNAAADTPGVTARRSVFDPPGGMLMWIVVVLELVVFSIVFFIVVLAVR